ncbi:MAG: hemin uptake protein HemP [Candidatus Omnitrophica bacterium]|nr:hemin uptake protein HemP [Candidatus Omnitrophota bacterium]
MIMDSGDKKVPVAGKTVSSPAEKKTYRSEDLFENKREIVIIHGEAHYRLQITKAGKLILNK